MPLPKYAEALLPIAGLVVAGLIGRVRGKSLVTAGRLTAEELDGFLLRLLIAFGLLFVVAGLLLALSPEPSVVCLTAFPPKHVFGTALWVVQAVLSCTVLWWVWASGGAELLARVAPVFTNGPATRVEFSPGRVRLFVTAVVVLAPLSNILVQLTQPILQTGCSWR